MQMEAFETIRIEKHGDGVTIATLNRPETGNAVNGVMHTEMMRLPYDADADVATKILVIAAEGLDFSIGGERTDPPKLHSHESLTGVMREARQVVHNMIDCETPIISVVRGRAFGFGATYALLADIVYAGNSAVFADTHTKFGVGAGDGGQLVWPLLIGLNRAKYYLMTGDEVAAAEAEALGLVNFVVDDEHVMETALALATRLASGPIQAIRACKAGIRAHLLQLSAAVMSSGLRAEQLNLLSADREEALRAFNENRAPRFTGM
jgi:enoyl-CoA hydratase